MSTFTKEEQLAAINDLREYDHCFLTEEGARALAKPFGVEPHLHEAVSDPHGTFKGLTFYDDQGKPLPGGTKRTGVEAHRLAEQICNHLRVPYDQKYGIGSQLRSCCDALEAHFTAAK